VRLLRGAALETGPVEELSGGVSSEIWKVGDVCVKRALPRLRVAQLWEAPISRNRYERLWLETAAAAAPGAAPRVLAADDEAGCFAMQFLDFPLWKSQLREGKADPAFAAKVGARLAAIHSATAGRPEVAKRFATDEIFYAIRLEPYLVATGKAHPDLAERMSFLVNRTSLTRVCLVHGDVSPKNILVGPEGPVFLDAECAWYGDPAFDLACSASIRWPAATSTACPSRAWRNARHRCFRPCCSHAWTASRRSNTSRIRRRNLFAEWRASFSPTPIP
jgi:aminoglycoside phosphotransferase (APT) family kinase protein